MKLALSVFVAAVALVVPGQASACSCIQWGKPRAELARANGAFVGVFLSRRPLRPPGTTTSSLDPFVYTFRVERILHRRRSKIVLSKALAVIVRDGVKGTELLVVAWKLTDQAVVIVRNMNPTKTVNDC